MPNTHKTIFNEKYFQCGATLINKSCLHRTPLSLIKDAQKQLNKKV